MISFTHMSVFELDGMLNIWIGWLHSSIRSYTSHTGAFCVCIVICRPREEAAYSCIHPMNIIF